MAFVVYDPTGLRVEVEDEARRDLLAERFGYSLTAPEPEGEPEGQEPAPSPSTTPQKGGK